MGLRTVRRTVREPEPVAPIPVKKTSNQSDRYTRTTAPSSSGCWVPWGVSVARYLEAYHTTRALVQLHSTRFDGGRKCFTRLAIKRRRVSYRGGGGEEKSLRSDPGSESRLVRETGERKCAKIIDRGRAKKQLEYKYNDFCCSAAPSSIAKTWC